MDLRALEHFVTVAEVGGFAEASRKLHLSQPTLSRSIAQLEEAVGAKLFSRGARGTTVTDDGRRLLPHALSILGEVRQAQALFDTANEKPLDPVVIEASPNFLHMGLPEALNSLFVEQPDTSAVVHTATMEIALDNVRTRKSDIALCLVAKHTHHHRNYEGLLFDELGTEMLIPVARPGHDALAGPQNLQALSTHEWAIPYQLSVSYRFETAFFRRNIPVPPQRLNCASITLMRFAVVDCGLIGLMPRSLVTHELRSGELRELDIEELRFEYVVLTAAAKLGRQNRRSIVIRGFLDRIRSAVMTAMQEGASIT